MQYFPPLFHRQWLFVKVLRQPVCSTCTFFNLFPFNIQSLNTLLENHYVLKLIVDWTILLDLLVVQTFKGLSHEEWAVCPALSRLSPEYTIHYHLLDSSLVFAPGTLVILPPLVFAFQRLTNFWITISVVSISSLDLKTWVAMC